MESQKPTSQARIKGVAMVILMEHNLEEAVAFYTSLGLPLIFHLREKWAEFAAGAVRIGLCPTSVKPDYDIQTGVVLEVDDLKSLYAERKDSIQFFGDPKEAAHGIMVSMKDPGGNIIDLYQATPDVLANLVKNVATEGCCGGQGPESSCKCR